MKLSVIIPCFNEEKTILIIIKKVVLSILPTGWEKEIIVIDDGSTDSTRNLLQNLDTKQFNIKIIRKTKNKGKGAALKSGFLEATGDFLVIQDADLEYDPDQFEKLLAPIIEKETNIVFGSRNLEPQPFHLDTLYVHGGIIITKIFNFLFHTRLTDATTCYKIFPSSFIPRLLTIKNNNFSYDLIYLTYALARKNKVVEVPILYNRRTKKDGKKLHWTDGIKVILVLLKLKYNEIILKLYIRD